MLQSADGFLMKLPADWNVIRIRVQIDFFSGKPIHISQVHNIASVNPDQERIGNTLCKLIEAGLYGHRVLLMIPGMHKNAMYTRRNVSNMLIQDLDMGSPAADDKSSPLMLAF